MNDSVLPRLLADPAKTLIFDFNDPDSQFTMFNHELAGCLLLQVSKPLRSDRGSATLCGSEIPSSVQSARVGREELWWIAVKPGGALHEYGQRAVLSLSGFCDLEGNEMPPVTLTVETPQRVLPDARDAEHEAVALQAAQDGIVLLKNEHEALPLKKGVLNFFGKDLYAFRICAVGAGKVLPRYTVGLLEAAAGESGWQLNEELLRFYARGENAVPEEETLSRARERSDTAILLLSRVAGENADSSSGRGEYALSEEEERLLSALRKLFAKLIVILNVGYPVGVEFVEKYAVDAVVYNGFGGMFAGRALMDVLTGRVNPSGKLPDTWWARWDSIPSSRNFYDCAGGKQRIRSDDQIWLNTVYAEELSVGYRAPGAGREGYPFGHGLSYTSFSIQPGSLHFDGSVLRVTASVKNEGHHAGREVVQLYLSKPADELYQPTRELVAFSKTRLLQPGESQTLSLSVPLAHMTSYDEAVAAYVALPGRYAVSLGGDVRKAKEIGDFRLEKRTVVRQVKNRLRSTLPLDTPSGVVPGANCLSPRREHVECFSHEPLPAPDCKLRFQDVLLDESLLPAFVGALDGKALARIAVCADHGWGMEGRGEAGRLFPVAGLNLPEFIIADGNSGVNMNTRNIGFPSGATLCASFDTELMEQVGRVIGEEARALGVHLILAPGMNLHRNPLCGRQPEYFSEDPLLAGVMAGHYCKGLESTGVGGCYKHLAANNAESGRKRNQSIVSERALRELYLRAFEIALEVHEPVSVMTAYNAVNGLFTSCDPELIQGVLFEEWGFDGFVMTDWTSYDSADVVEMAAAGNCWITPGSEDDTFTKQLEAALLDGRLPLPQLQQNVLRILRALVKLHRAKGSL